MENRTMGAMARDGTVHAELAELVAKIAGGASSRGIAQRAPISHATAAKLLRGEHVDENTLLLFAIGYGTPLNPLRVAMGLEPLPIDPLEGATGSRDAAATASERMASHSSATTTAPDAYQNIVVLPTTLDEGGEIVLEEGQRARLRRAGGSVEITPEVLRVLDAIRIMQGGRAGD